MKKSLTACLAEGPRVIYFDNADVLHSGELASASTAETYAARILGVSKLLRVPVRVQWVGSVNNAMLSGKLYRRMIGIRIGAKMADPEDRDISQFRIMDLKARTVEHQARQVVAALTIIQFWVDKGMPKGNGSKASFEASAQKMSGLFDCIGVEGFLETPKDRRPEDPEAEQLRTVIIALWKAQREYEQGRAQYKVDLTRPKATDVLVVLNAMNVQVDLGMKEPSRAPGELLRKHQGRVFEFESLKGATMRLWLKSFVHQNMTRWQVRSEREAPPDEARLELVDTTPF